MGIEMAEELGRIIKENAECRAVEGSHGPYSWERIDSSIDGVNYRISDANDDRVATRYTKEDAKHAVELLNRGVKVPNLLERK